MPKGEHNSKLRLVTLVIAAQHESFSTMGRLMTGREISEQFGVSTNWVSRNVPDEYRLASTTTFKEIPKCRVCGAELTEENWFPSNRIAQSRICKECHWRAPYRKGGSYLEKQRRAASRSNRRSRFLLLELLGLKCARCGFSDVRTLQIDHINGGGRKELKAMGRTFYRYYLQHPDEARARLQTLCANCNWIKKAENDEVSRWRRRS